MNTNEMINTLKTETRKPISGKHAKAAIEHISAGLFRLAINDCLNGHFVAGHDGDKTFLPVRIALEDMISVPVESYLKLCQAGDSFPPLQFCPHPPNAESYPSDGGEPDRPRLGAVGAKFLMHNS